MSRTLPTHHGSARRHSSHARARTRARTLARLFNYWGGHRLKCSRDDSAKDRNSIFVEVIEKKHEKKEESVYGFKDNIEQGSILKGNTEKEGGISSLTSSRGSFSTLSSSSEAFFGMIARQKMGSSTRTNSRGLVFQSTAFSRVLSRLSKTTSVKHRTCSWNTNYGKDCRPSEVNGNTTSTRVGNHLGKPQVTVVKGKDSVGQKQMHHLSDHISFARIRGQIGPRFQNTFLIPQW